MVRTVAAIILSLGCLMVQAAEVRNLRVWDGPDKTRAVLDLSGPADYKLFSLNNPDRIVVDLAGSDAAKGLKVPASKDSLVSGVRTGRRNKSDLRVVLDLSDQARAKSFLLKPVDPYGHRLVIDLYPLKDGQAKPVKRVERNRDVVVAIDAGHGGEDPGAIGKRGTREKDVVLALAKEVKALLDQEPGLRGVLVRSGDYYIPHQQRPQKARDQQADLFISIHADAFRDSRVHGSGVFVLSSGRASSEAAQWLADRENRADLVGGVKLDDKDATLAAVLLDLSQSASMEASEEAAGKVLASLARVGPVHKNYVESASFAVLTSPDIPSMLIEAGFITNPGEEKRLTSKNWRRKSAAAIVEGVRNYFYQYPPPGSWLADNRSTGEHVVSRGETLSGIAQKHRVSLARLRAVNNIDGDLLRAGEVLRIPASAP